FLAWPGGTALALPAFLAWPGGTVDGAGVFACSPDFFAWPGGSGLPAAAFLAWPGGSDLAFPALLPLAAGLVLAVDGVPVPASLLVCPDFAIGFRDSGVRPERCPFPPPPTVP